MFPTLSDFSGRNFPPQCSRTRVSAALVEAVVTTYLSRVPDANPGTRLSDGSSDLNHHGEDHRPAAVRVGDPLAYDPADELLNLVRFGDAILRGPEQRLLDLRCHRGERRVLDARAAGVNVRAADDLARRAVHHHKDGDDALFAKDPPVLEGRLGDVAD